jgi:hypothetical protein
MSRKHALAKAVSGLLGPSLNFCTRITKMNSGLTVFLFHEVTDNPSEFLKQSGMWVSKEVFEKQVNWIVKNFEVLPIGQILEKSALPRNAAVITFDDAWAGMFNAIEEVLLPRGIPACLFLNFGTIISRIDVCAGEKYLRERQPQILLEDQDVTSAVQHLPEQLFKDFLDYQGSIVEMNYVEKISKSSKITFGNHLYNHYDCKKIPDDKFIEEFRLNKISLELFPNNSDNRFFAFPFGTPGINFTDRHLDLLKNEEVAISFSGTSRRLSKFNPREVLIPRIHFSPSDSLEGNCWWACFKNQLLRRF